MSDLTAPAAVPFSAAPAASGLYDPANDKDACGVAFVADARGRRSRDIVAKGLTAKQIADRLVISHRTVENHVQSTLRKLQLHNRVELARYAIEHGLDRDT